ncbi:MAG: hypothetical protein IJE08_13460 [Clostridia bacterium]|nr:hypothetical protein [Clostridia bacterium]
MSAGGDIFSDMMSFGEKSVAAAEPIKAVARAAGGDWLETVADISVKLAFAAGVVSTIADMVHGMGGSDRQQNQVLENQRQQLEELERQMEEHQGAIDDHLKSISLTGSILDTLEAHKVRLCMAVPDGEEELGMLRRLWEQLNGMPPEEQAANWESASRLHRQARALEKEYLDYERRWLDSCTEWTARWNALNDMLTQGNQFPLPVYTTSGQETVRIDCDYWSHGALKEAAKALPPLEQPEDTTLTGFSDLMKQADDLSARVQDILHQAGEAFVGKEMRIQLSNSILAHLEERGWLTTECGFEKDDERERVTLKLKNPAQDTVTFVLKPDNTLQMRPDFKGVHNRNVMDGLARVLQTVLQQNGITIDQVSFV